MVNYHELIPLSINTPDSKKYLIDRGINSDLAGKLDIITVPGQHIRTHPRAHQHVAVIIPYRDRGGKLTEYWAARFVEKAGPREVSFADGVAPLPKAYQPHGESVRGYLCPLNDWISISNGSTIFIAESCIKAIAIGQCRKYAIGLSGVSCGAPKGVLIPEISELPVKAKNLKFCIVFDSDTLSNPDVSAAMSHLAEKIYEKFKVRTTWLPLPHGDDEKKQGFDDFFVKDHIQAIHFLDGIGEEIPGTELQMKIVDMNSEVCIVMEGSVVVKLDSGNVMHPADFKVNYANWTAALPGKTRVSVAECWLKSEIRNEVIRMEYMPESEERICLNSDEVRIYNTYHGMGCEEKEGDTTFFHEYLAFAIPRFDLITQQEVSVGEETGREYFIEEHLRDQWAWILQNPGKKLNTILILFGDEGTGKSMIMRPFKRMFGDNYAQISNSEIREKYTGSYGNKMLIHIDELKKGRGDAEDLVSQRIRMLVTEEDMQNRLMHKDHFKSRNCANLVITSNDADCLRINDGDRRTFVVRMNYGYEHFIEYVEQNNYGGAEALMHELRRKIFHKMFNPYQSRAWLTPWKKDLINYSKDWLEAKIAELWEDPDSIIVIPTGARRRTIYSTRDLVPILYEGKQPSDVLGASRRIGQILEKSKFKKAANGVMFRGPEGRQSTYWIIRKEENDNSRWEDAFQCRKDMEGKLG